MVNVARYMADSPVRSRQLSRDIFSGVLSIKRQSWRQAKPRVYEYLLIRRVVITLVELQGAPGNSCAREGSEFMYS